MSSLCVLLISTNERHNLISQFKDHSHSPLSKKVDLTPLCNSPHGPLLSDCGSLALLNYRASRVRGAQQTAQQWAV